MMAVLSVGLDLLPAPSDFGRPMYSIGPLARRWWQLLPILWDKPTAKPSLAVFKNQLRLIAGH